jgi:hypothetical protein
MPITLHLPVTICLGASCTRVLVTVEDILDFLDEWPPARRGPIRDQVRPVCLGVAGGEATREEARQAFVAYARMMNVMKTEPIFDPVQSRPRRPAARD